MATNTKNKEWAKANKDMLMGMLDKGYIALEDLQAINNKDEKFTIEQQDAAFDRVKKDIQSRYSDERLDGTDVLNEDEKKAFRTFRQSVDKFDKPADALLSSKLIEQINSSGYKDIPLLKGMSEQVKGLSDSDVREYIYNQRQYLNTSLPTKVIESIPDLQEYMTVQPNYGVKNTNYAKMFNNPDILDKLNEYSFRDIDYIARKNGMTGKELIKDLTNAKIAKDRDDISHGRWRSDAPFLENVKNEIGGTMMTLFGPRQQEAIARGEDPSWQDYVGDVGEGLLYAAPVGRFAKPVSTFKKLAYTGLSNALVPHVSEAYDALAYDDPNNPRGEYSEVDALTGTGVNLVAPVAIRGLGKGVGRYTDSPKLTKIWGEMAEGMSADDVIKAAEKERDFISRNRSRINQKGNAGDLTPEYYKKIASSNTELTNKNENQLMKSLSKENGVTTPNQQALNAAIKDPDILSSGDYLTIYKKSKDVANSKGSLDNLYKYDVKEFKQIVKAWKKGEKTYKWHGEVKEVPNVKELKAALDPDFVKKYQNSPYATSMFLKTERDLVAEDAFKNYLTNQFGNHVYANKTITFPVVNMLPIDLNQLLRDYNADKERQVAMEQSRKRLPTLESLYGNLK